ncbi:glycosyltransferase [Patescibacteria group bacterium]|nr:glycosyltransferase [Patescibacteria group bacterium]MBU1029163.1 glycosyltransferase [Patescibacteria group bacterium]
MRLIIALPVLNEELLLRRSVERVLESVRLTLPGVECLVVIADNGSTDRTKEIGLLLAQENQSVRYLRLTERGKGRAVLAAWQSAPADVFTFMDIDLSTDLKALPSLYEAVITGGGVASGSRFHPQSKVMRSRFRRWYSFGYRTLLHLLFKTSVSDAPCGFKAISRAVFEQIVPQVEDRRWFFDTELILRAERAGFVLQEIPVIWQEQTIAGRKSRVLAPRLAVEYLFRLISLKKRLQ